MFSRRSTQGTRLEERFYNSDKILIEKFIKEQDLPSWFRGMSPFQWQAGRDLFNALRDDAEQHTSHRVRHCLLMIGLKPIPKARDIRLLMHISRGNDLAFLWFLLELRYRTARSDHYTTNEQIIMNVIAMLDMITTMRGLDQVLPPPQPTKKEIARMKQRKRKTPRSKAVPQQSELDVMASKHHPKFRLPYFERLRHPVPYGKPLTSQRADHKLNFEFYENYANPNYVVPNESNRWFAAGNYSLGGDVQSKRIITSFINRELLAPDTGRLWEYCDDNSCSRCAHHKVIDELEMSLKHELAVIARNRCLGSREAAQKAERARVRKELEARAELHLRNFRRLANSTRNSMSHICLLEKDGSLRFDLPECEDPPREKRCRTATEIIGDSKCQCSLDDVERPKPSPSRNCCWPPADCGDCLLYSPSQESLSGQRLLSKKRKCEHQKGNADTIQETVLKLDPHKYYNYGHSDHAVTPTPSTTFFSATRPTKPYKFDYGRLFYFKNLCGADTLCKLRESCFEAMECEKCDLNLLSKSHTEQLSTAVEKSAKRMFQERLQKWDEEEDAREQETKNRLKSPRLSYYDPDDKELMNQVLKEGLMQLAQDPKYVLASMPDVHKHPTLRFWVLRRFGKVFSREELSKEWKKTARIIRVLFENTLHVDLPHISDIGQIATTDYSCRNYLLKKSNRLRAKFYKQLDDALMDQARTLYIAMNPYLCSSGPPRNTFFSYMPPRRIDIQHFRVWKPNELMFEKTVFDLPDFFKRK